jgi:hypothetical protein
MASIIQQMKNNIAFKINSLVSNPEADAYAAKEAENKKRKAERDLAEKESAERLARQRAKSKRESEILLKTNPGVDRIESIYTKTNDAGDEEDFVDVSWKPRADGTRDKNFVTKKRDFDSFVNSVDPELLKTLYATYEQEQKDAQRRVEKANFSVARMTKTTFSNFWSIFSAVLKVLIGILAASLATNLNLYKPWLYRILYAIFAYRYWFLVLPYVFLYRWAYLKKQPVFYSLIPLVPLRFENRFLSQFYSWLSYKPDDEIASQKEWLQWKKEHEE